MYVLLTSLVCFLLHYHYAFSPSLYALLPYSSLSLFSVPQPSLLCPSTLSPLSLNSLSSVPQLSPPSVPQPSLLCPSTLSPLSLNSLPSVPQLSPPSVPRPSLLCPSILCPLSLNSLSLIHCTFLSTTLLPLHAFSIPLSLPHPHLPLRHTSQLRERQPRELNSCHPQYTRYWQLILTQIHCDIASSPGSPLHVHLSDDL